MKIYFSTSPTFNLGSALIMCRLGIRRPFSHVALEFTIAESSRTLFFECTDFGARLVTKEVFFSKNKIIRELPLLVSQEREQEIKEFIFSQLGKRYSILGPLCHVVTWLFNRPIITKKLDFHSYSCSEIIYLCLKQEIDPYINHLYFSYPHLITPGDVFRGLFRYHLSLENRQRSPIPLSLKTQTEGQVSINQSYVH